MNRSTLPLIELRGVTRLYGTGNATVAALRGIDLTIDRGEFVAVMGPSGSGKSTCMNLLGCLDSPTAGSYRFEGVEVSTLDRDQRALLRRHFLGFVFQGFNLLNRTSALENVELPLIYRGLPAAERRARARRALTAVGLSGWESHSPGELSGGQQQRVAIARAIVTDPAVLFADEPTGNLDSERSVEIMELLSALNNDHAITVVMVTHEPEMAEYAHRTLHFHDGHLIRDVQDERMSRRPGMAGSDDVQDERMSRRPGMAGSDDVQDERMSRRAAGAGHEASGGQAP